MYIHRIELVLRKQANVIHPRKAPRKLEQAVVKTARKVVSLLEEIYSLRKFIRRWRNIKRYLQ